MHDLRAIRENPAAFDEGLKRRFLEPRSSQILSLDEEHRALTTKAQEMQSRRNEASKEIGKVKAQGGDAQAVMDEVAELKAKLPEIEAQAGVKEGELKSILETLPNIPFEDVPVGKDEDDNVEVRKWGVPPELGFEPKQHFDIGEGLGQMDFEGAAAMSGARFVLLKGGIARLERALAQFMLDTHTSVNGLTETSPPLLVRDNALYGTGQLPKFEEDLFKTDSGHYLIPTSEVPLTNLAADKIIDTETLPHRYTALTPCFRSEAGSAGRDTRGMIRLHQFQKVEMVSITAPDQSEAELERMTACAEDILQRLELPYRVMLLSSGDMGFGARKTYDLEVWLPGQDAYREISSCSNCGDFQARRMKARCRPRSEKITNFVHTLNGSGLATGRALVAVLENYQQADGTVKVPQALKPYMGGIEVLKPA